MPVISFPEVITDTQPSKRYCLCIGGFLKSPIRNRPRLIQLGLVSDEVAVMLSVSERLFSQKGVEVWYNEAKE